MYEEFKYMKNIKTVEEFKDYVKKDSTCSDVFWRYMGYKYVREF